MAELASTGGDDPYMGPEYSITMEESVRRSPRYYSSMRSNSARFGAEHTYTKKDPKLKNVLSGADYKTDSGHKKTLYHAVKKSPIGYSNMRSVVPRFPKDPWEKDKLNNNKLDYDTDQGGKKYMTTAIHDSAVRYNKAFKSKVPRFAKKPVGVDPVVAAASATLDYDTDTGNKKALLGNVEKSSVKYANMRTVSPRFKPSLPKAYVTSLGPGSYQPGRSQTVCTPRSPRTLILDSDSGKRFYTRPDPSQNLGTAVTPDRDTNVWHEKGFYASRSAKTGFVPPIKMDQMYDLDNGNKMSLKTSVEKTAVSYSKMRSLEPRTANLASFQNNFLSYPKAKFACASRIGPGSYNLAATKNGTMNDLQVTDSARQHMVFMSKSPRVPAREATDDHQMWRHLARMNYEVWDDKTISQYVDQSPNPYLGLKDLRQGTRRIQTAR